MAGRGALGAAAVAAGLVGAAAGALVERRLVRRSVAGAVAAGTQLGSVHSTPRIVTAPDGVELYAEVDEPVAGAGYDGLTVVLSHGYALNLDSWHYQRLGLGGAVRLVLWDQRGHGRSGRPPSGGRITIDDLGADLEAVVETLAPEGDLVLVGHSMGGMTTMALAERRPDLLDSRVRGVALLATSSGNMGQVSLGLPAGVGKVAQRFAPGVVANLARNKDIVDLARRTGSDLEFVLTRHYAFGSDVSPALVDFTSQMIVATPVEVLADFFPAFSAHDKAKALAAMAGSQVLIMVGEEDLLTPVEHSRTMARLLPDAVLDVLSPCGHMIQLEYPEQVNQRLRELLVRSRADGSLPPP